MHLSMYGQGNGDAKDDHSEHSRSSRDVSDRRGDRKQTSVRSRSRSRSRSAGQSRSRNQSRDRHSRHEEGYRDKYRDKSAPKDRVSRQDVNSKDSRRVVQFDPRGERRSSGHRHHSRDGRTDRGRNDHRHHRSHSHPSHQSHEADRGHSRDSSDRKRRRDDYCDHSPSEGTPMLSFSVLLSGITGCKGILILTASCSAVVHHHKSSTAFGGSQMFNTHLVLWILVLKKFSH